MFSLVKNIWKYINRLRTPEEQLMTTVFLAATIILFTILLRTFSSGDHDEKIKYNQLEIKSDSVTRVLQKKCDDCEDARFKDKLDQIEKLEIQSHRQDSLLEILRTIK